MSEPPSKKAKHERKNLELDFAGASTPAELLQKQLHAVRSLLDVYTVEHHAVLEELYACHASRGPSAHQQPNAATGPGPQPSTGLPGTGPKEPSTQTPPLRLRHLLPQLHATTQQEKTQGETPAAKAPGFVVPGVTSAPEQQQQPQHTPQHPLNQPQQLESSKQQEAPKQQQQQQQQASTPSQPQHPTMPPHAATAVCKAESQNSGAVSLDTWVGARPHAGTPQSVSQPQAQAEGASPLPPLGARAEPAAPIHLLSVVKESATEGEQLRDDAAQQQQQQWQQQQQQKSSEAEGAATAASRGGQGSQPKKGASSAGPASMDVDQGEGSAAVPGQPHAGVGKGKGASAGAGTAEAMEVEGAELQRGADSIEKEGSAKGEGAGDQQQPQQQQQQHENQQRDGDGAEVKVEGMHAGGIGTCQQQQQQQGAEHGAVIKDKGRAVLQPGSSHEQPPQHPSQATSAHTATAEPTAATVAPSAIAPSAAAATATAATAVPSATPPSTAAAATATATSVPHSAATAVHAGAVSAAAGRAAPAGAPAPAGEPTSSAAAAPGSATAHNGGSHDAPPAAQSQAQGQAVLTTAPQAHEGGGDGGDGGLHATPAAQTLTAAAPAAATHPGATPSTGEIAPSVSQHATRTLAPNLIGQYGDEVLGFGGVYHQRGVFTFGEAKGLVRDLLGSAEVRQQQQQQHSDGMQESAPATAAAAAAVAVAPPQGAEPPSSQSATAGAAPAPSEGVAGQSTAPLVASAEELGAWRARFVDALPQIAQLEAAASATTEQELDVEGALACLAGRTGRYLIKRTTVLLGRSTEAKGAVDVDLSCEGSSKVSRRQAYLTLEADGHFKITNAGQRLMMVDCKQVQQFESARVDHLSLIEVGDVPLLLLVNKAAVQRVQRRTRRAAA